MTTTHLRSLALTLALVSLAACGDGDTKKKDPVTPKAGAEPAAASSGGGAAPAGGAFDKSKATGSLKGVVKFKGAAPAAKMLGITSSSDAFCKSCGDKQVEALEVNADGTVPHVFVYANSGPYQGMTGFDVPDVVIDQKGCVYEPHVVGVIAGQPFTVKTSDSTTHNVKASPKRQSGFNLMQPAGKVDKVSFKSKEAAIKLQCDVHTWMSAYVFSMDHPFFATSGRSGGTFEIQGLLPGKYKFKAWHETWAKEAKEYEVEIKDGQAAELTIEIGG